MNIPEIILNTLEPGEHNYTGIARDIKWDEWEDKFLANGIVFIKRSTTKGLVWRKYPHHLTREEAELMKKFENLRRELNNRILESQMLNEIFVPKRPDDLEIEKETGLVSYNFKMSNTDVTVEFDDQGDGKHEISFGTYDSHNMLNARMKQLFTNSMSLFNIIIWCVIDYTTHNRVKEFLIDVPRDSHSQSRLQLYGNMLERPEIIAYLARHNLKPNVKRKGDDLNKSLDTVTSVGIIS